MYESATPAELEALKNALAESDAFKVKAALEELYPAQILEHWSELAPEHRLPILTLLSPADAAEVFSHLSEAEQAELLEALPPWRVKEILEELSLDDLADAINAVEEEKSPEAAEALLRQLDPKTRAEVEELTEYEEDQAGGIMTPEYIAVRDTMRVEEVFRFLRREAPDAEQIYVIYVVDGEEHLKGVLTLRDLIVADPKTKVSEIMNPDVIYVRDDTDQEEVARIMADYNFTVLPVVDEEKKLVGIVTIDDVVDVIEEEATEDIYRLGAVESPELVYSQSGVLALWSARIRWLIILILTGSITSSILQGFESVLEAATALAFYVPVLVGTGGNTGNQSSTLIVRALATRDVGLSDWVRILRKEVGVGMLLGLTLALLLALKVLLDGQAHLLLVVGVSLGLVVLLANVVGAMLPLLLRRLRLDPALISNPLIATITDVTGLIVYLSVARLLLNL
ncbi:magnesium transporter [Meiothermus sp. QL-1]|uniref:magnesium transporter n=1 Tax=Meiothermus sp. QL-1 TaxID=2058095 RepID=UPI000E0C53FB|nr:magnesium transporter [Meiothermus sp. QL-1]RDI96595.1 magnesium transporter [Meiothermus sp. QL-1]